MERLQIIDIGARWGLDPRWAPYKNEIECIGVEPNREECDRLNAAGGRYLPVALGERDGETATLHITREPGCSSLLRPNTAFVEQFTFGEQMRVVATETVDLARLDTVCLQEGIRPDVLKLDTQGTELSILKGAGDLLKDVLLIQCEIEFVQTYEGQPIFAEVDGFLRGWGFRILGMERHFWRRKEANGSPFGGQLIFCDAVYVKEQLPATRKAMVALAAYRQHDLMMALDPVMAPGLIQPRSWKDKLGSMVLARWPHRWLRVKLDQMRGGPASDWNDAGYF